MVAFLISWGIGGGGGGVFILTCFVFLLVFFRLDAYPLTPTSTTDSVCYGVSKFPNGSCLVIEHGMTRHESKKTCVLYSLGLVNVQAT